LAARHPWAVHAQALADRPAKPDGTPAVYNDNGQWNLYLFRATGDPAYARKAGTRVKAVVARVVDGGGNRNTTREFTAYAANAFRLVRPHLDPADDRAIADGLKVWAGLILGKDPDRRWGTRLADSDETTGHYLGLAAIDRALGTNYLGDTWPGGPRGAKLPVSKMREAVVSYVEKAKGGNWIESGWEYNLGTLNLLLTGVLEVGKEGWPEVRRLAPEVADYLLWSLAPDLRSHAGWGDAQSADRRRVKLDKWVPVLGVLAAGYADELGPGRAARARRAVRDLTRGLAPSQFWLYLDVPLRYGFDPRVGEADPAPLDLETGVYEAGGSAVFRTKTALLHVHTQPDVGVDHQTYGLGAVRLRVDGADVVDHLIGYGSSAVHGACWNSVLGYGIAGGASRGVAKAEALPGGGARIVCRAAGPPPTSATWNKPADLGTITRTVEADPAATRVTVVDAFDLKRPLPPGRGAGQAIYQNRGKNEARDVETALTDPAGVRAAQTHWWVRGPYTLETRDGVSTLTYTAGGRPVRLEVSGHRRTVEEPVEVVCPTGGDFTADEKKAAVRVGFVSADPRATITTVIRVGAGQAPRR
ncbi:MAG: hypothetical protein K2X87_28290, partial [Gemmataceae bacterium]|nr:hypothetical protein [Gemmataceae bacterium]